MKKPMFIVMSAAILAVGSSGWALSADSQTAYKARVSNSAPDQLILARGGDDLCPRHGKGDECDDHVVVNNATEQSLLARGGDDLCPRHGKGDECDDHVVTRQAVDQLLLVHRGRSGGQDDTQPHPEDDVI